MSCHWTAICGSAVRSDVVHDAFSARGTAVCAGIMGGDVESRGDCVHSGEYLASERGLQRGRKIKSKKMKREERGFDLLRSVCRQDVKGISHKALGKSSIRASTLLQIACSFWKIALSILAGQRDVTMFPGEWLSFPGGAQSLPSYCQPYVL